MTTYEEWRVTGTPKRAPKLSANEWIFSGETFNDPEAEARAFIARNTTDWTDGPHLHKRTVTVTDWEEA